MSANTGIEWADHTYNPWKGCSAISPGCDHCYAKAWVERFGGNFDIRVRTKTSGDPVKWNKQEYFECMGCGRRGTAAELAATDERECDCSKHMEPTRQRVFCASLADVFDNAVVPTWRDELFTLIANTPNLDWLLLTKRIGNASTMLPWMPGYAGPDGQRTKNAWNNVWIGASIVNQEEADRDIPKLMRLPAKIRFVSLGPLLGAVDLSQWLDIIQYEDNAPWMRRNVGHMHDMLDWVIVEGETQKGARPMLPDWPRGIRDQCEAAKVPFLFKQWGEWHTGYVSGDGSAAFRQFKSFEQWVNKASTWVNGGICLDKNGKELKNGADMMDAREQGNFPVTIMHKVGKKNAGRLLDGQIWHGIPS